MHFAQAHTFFSAVNRSTGTTTKMPSHIVYGAEHSPINIETPIPRHWGSTLAGKRRKFDNVGARSGSFAGLLSRAPAVTGTSNNTTPPLQRIASLSASNARKLRRKAWRISKGEQIEC